jgi:hypothetical protein
VVEVPEVEEEAEAEEGAEDLVEAEVEEGAEDLVDVEAVEEGADSGALGDAAAVVVLEGDEVADLEVVAEEVVGVAEDSVDRHVALVDEVVEVLDEVEEVSAGADSKAIPKQFPGPLSLSLSRNLNILMVGLPKPNQSSSFLFLADLSLFLCQSVSQCGVKKYVLSAIEAFSPSMEYFILTSV